VRCLGMTGAGANDVRGIDSNDDDADDFDINETEGICFVYQLLL